MTATALGWLRRDGAAYTEEDRRELEATADVVGRALLLARAFAVRGTAGA